MDRAAVTELMQNVVRPPNASQVYAAPPTVAIVNASGAEDMPYVAADRNGLPVTKITEVRVLDPYFYR